MTRASEREPGDPLLDDPALAEALAAVAANGRLSNERVRQMRASRRRALGTAGAAMLVLAIGGGGWLGLRPVPSVTEHYRTARGQQLAVRLADGSSLRLNGATSLDVTLAHDHREVVLNGGEAFFDIAHDARRPFEVAAGDVSARVLGTAFDLDRTTDQVKLGVFRGAVRFGGRSPGTHGVVVKQGWRSRYRDGAVDAPASFDTDQQDWRQGWLDTEGMRLTDMVEALNRGGGPLVLPPPPALAALPIAGRFKLDDPARLLHAIGSAYGFSVVRDGQGLRLVPAAD